MSSNSSDKCSSVGQSGRPSEGRSHIPQCPQSLCRSISPAQCSRVCYVGPCSQRPCCTAKLKYVTRTPSNKSSSQNRNSRYGKIRQFSDIAGVDRHRYQSDQCGSASCNRKNYSELLCRFNRLKQRMEKCPEEGDKQQTIDLCTILEEEKRVLTPCGCNKDQKALSASERVMTTKICTEYCSTLKETVIETTQCTKEGVVNIKRHIMEKCDNDCSQIDDKNRFCLEDEEQTKEEIQKEPVTTLDPEKEKETDDKNLKDTSNEEEDKLKDREPSPKPTTSKDKVSSSESTSKMKEKQPSPKPTTSKDKVSSSESTSKMKEKQPSPKSTTSKDKESSSESTSKMKDKQPSSKSITSKDKEPSSESTSKMKDKQPSSKSITSKDKEPSSESTSKIKEKQPSPKRTTSTDKEPSSESTSKMKEKQPSPKSTTSKDKEPSSESTSKMKEKQSPPKPRELPRESTLKSKPPIPKPKEKSPRPKLNESSSEDTSKLTPKQPHSRPSAFKPEPKKVIPSRPSVPKPKELLKRGSLNEGTTMPEEMNAMRCTCCCECCSNKRTQTVDIVGRECFSKAVAQNNDECNRIDYFLTGEKSQNRSATRRSSSFGEPPLSSTAYPRDMDDCDAQGNSRGSYQRRGNYNSNDSEYLDENRCNASPPQSYNTTDNRSKHATRERVEASQLIYEMIIPNEFNCQLPEPEDESCSDEQDITDRIPPKFDSSPERYSSSQNSKSVSRGAVLRKDTSCESSDEESSSNSSSRNTSMRKRIIKTRSGPDRAPSLELLRSIMIPVIYLGPQTAWPQALQSNAPSRLAECKCSPGQGHNAIACTFNDNWSGGEVISSTARTPNTNCDQGQKTNAPSDCKCCPGQGHNATASSFNDNWSQCEDISATARTPNTNSDQCQETNGPSGCKCRPGQGHNWSRGEDISGTTRNSCSQIGSIGNSVGRESFLPLHVYGSSAEESRSIDRPKKKRKNKSCSRREQSGEDIRQSCKTVAEVIFPVTQQRCKDYFPDETSSSGSTTTCCFRAKRKKPKNTTKQHNKNNSSDVRSMQKTESSPNLAMKTSNSCCKPQLTSCCCATQTPSNFQYKSSCCGTQTSQSDCTRKPSVVFEVLQGYMVQPATNKSNTKKLIESETPNRGCEIKTTTSRCDKQISKCNCKKKPSVMFEVLHGYLDQPIPKASNRECCCKAQTTKVTETETPSRGFQIKRTTSSCGQQISQCDCTRQPSVEFEELEDYLGEPIPISSSIQCCSEAQVTSFVDTQNPISFCEEQAPSCSCSTKPSQNNCTKKPSVTFEELESMDIQNQNMSCEEKDKRCCSGTQTSHCNRGKKLSDMLEKFERYIDKPTTSTSTNCCCNAQTPQCDCCDASCCTNTTLCEISNLQERMACHLKDGIGGKNSHNKHQGTQTFIMEKRRTIFQPVIVPIIFQPPVPNASNYSSSRGSAGFDCSYQCSCPQNFPWKRSPYDVQSYDPSLFLNTLRPQQNFCAQPTTTTTYQNSCTCSHTPYFHPQYLPPINSSYSKNGPSSSNKKKRQEPRSDS